MRQLRCFVRVCEVGSITGAAADLNIAQPALGLQIKSLEHELGATLLIRSHRGVTPTEAGELVLEWSRRILQQANNLKAQIKELTVEGNLSIALGLTPSLIGLMAGAMVERVTKQALSLELKIVENLSHVLANWVESEDLDVAFGFGSYQLARVEQTPILRERLFYLSKDNGQSGSIDLAEVLEYPLALTDENNSIRRTVENGAKQIECPVIVQYEISSRLAAIEIACRGIAGAIIPYGDILKHIPGDMSVRVIKSPALERTLYLLRLRHREPTKAEYAIINIAIEVLTEAVEKTAGSGAYVMLNEGPLEVE